MIRVSIKLLISIILVLTFSLMVSEEVKAAKFYVEPEIISAEAEHRFPVDIFINANGEKTDGADVVLNFNSERLKAVEIKPGIAYPEYPIQRIEDSLVKITGIAESEGPFFSGEELFATVWFEPILGGEEFLKFDFSDGFTSDSNVSAHGEGTDLLSEVEGSILYISGPGQSEPFISTTTAGKIILILVYIIIIVIVGFIFYRWWVRRTSEPDIFIPEKAPLDKPPKFGD